jgi:hypothetical protein
MALIATDHRAQLVAAAALLLIAVAPWRMPERASCERKTVTIEVWELGPRLVTPAPGPLAIETGIDPVLMPNGFHSWTHPDMRPWPAGMVIQPPTSSDRNLLQRLGLWDRLLSALLGPLRPTSA